MGLFDIFSGLFDGGSDETETSQSTAGDSAPDTGDNDDDGETKDISEYGPADFRREAEEFAADHDDYDFDFTVESLARLDEYARSQTEVLHAVGEEGGGANAVVDQLRKGYVLWWGSYFGEVLVRQLDAEWVTDEDSVYVQVPTAMQPMEILVLDAAMGAVEGEPEFAAMAADLQEDIAAAETAAETDAEPIAEVIDSLSLDPSVALDTAHKRAVEAFSDAGYQVSAGDIINSVDGRAAEDCTRLFTFYRGSAMHIGVVYEGEWDEADTNAIVALLANLRRDEEIAGVHVINARKLPAEIAYLSGTHPRGAFATAALVGLQTGPPFGPDSVPHYAEVGQELLVDHLDVVVDSVDTAALERLDDVVLSQLRTVPETSSQDGYTPQEALLLVGALAGEVMARMLESEYPVETEWSAGDEISSTGVVLTVRGTETGAEASVNPVGKALKLFDSGNEDSIAFMYQTVERIVEDDLI
ncbi:hypothetical protein ACOJIV_05220 [Haloarcula sp. AONF1]